jgi:hypothetical protein
VIGDKMKKKLFGGVAAALVAAGLVTASPANAAQGGFDSRLGHTWVKIGRAEYDASRASNRWCWSALRGVPASVNQYIACDNLAAAVRAERAARPNANGYWAEWNPTTRKGRQGTW